MALIATGIDASIFLLKIDENRDNHQVLAVLL